MTSLKSLLMVGSLLSGQAPFQDFYHDFRDGKPLPAQLTYFGPPDGEEFVKPEVGGLRITPPPTGQQTWGWGVAGRFALSGDFEVTATYELITAERPTKGVGVGVALNLEPDNDKKKFAKVGRFVGIKLGDSYVAESRVGVPEKYKGPWVPAESRLGQLRFVRKGAMLQFLVADAPGAEFREILQTEFGAEDMDMVRFIANNNSSPTLLDARLLDLRIRSGDLIPVKDFDLSKAGLVQGLLLGLLLTLVLLSLGVWLYTRRKRRAQTSPAKVAADGQQAELEQGAALIGLSCAGCGKNLKAKAELAGKKIKCPQCGQVTMVPAPKAAEA